MNLIGRKIVGIREIPVEEVQTVTWGDNRPSEALVLDDGSQIYALSDPEGNAMGCMMFSPPDEEGAYYIQMPKEETNE